MFQEKPSVASPKVGSKHTCNFKGFFFKGSLVNLDQVFYIFKINVQLRLCASSQVGSKLEELSTTLVDGKKRSIEEARRVARSEKRARLKVSIKPFISTFYF